MTPRGLPATPAPPAASHPRTPPPPAPAPAAFPPTLELRPRPRAGGSTFIRHISANAADGNRGMVHFQPTTKKKMPAFLTAVGLAKPRGERALERSSLPNNP
jgi:hypothetical protein